MNAILKSVVSFDSVKTRPESAALIESFRSRAEAVGAQVERVATRELALEFVVRLLHQEAVNGTPNSGAVWAACPIVGSSDYRRLEGAVPGLKFAGHREL